MDEVFKKVLSVLIVTFGLPLIIRFLLSFIEILFLTEIKTGVGGHFVIIGFCTLMSFVSIMLAFVEDIYILKKHEKI